MVRNFRRRQAGQSLPLLVVMLVVIIGMVGLSVDAGNAYGQQRRVQNIANVGALAAMNAATRNTTNGNVWNNVKRTLAANRVDLASGYYEVKADYVFANGNPQPLGHWRGQSENVTNPTANPPRNFTRIQVTITETIPTYFARVVGRNELTVNANGNACVGDYGVGTYPVGIPTTLNSTVHDVYNPGSNTPYAQDGTNTVWNEVSTGTWTNMVGKEFIMRFRNKAGGQLPPGTHVGWLTWGEQGTNVLAESLAFPGNLQDGFQETQPAGEEITNVPDGTLDPLDWSQGDTGNRFSSEVEAELSVFRSRGEVMILPMYQRVVGNGSNASFLITRFGQFQMINYNRQGEQSWLRFRYLGDANAIPANCSGEPPFTVEERRFNISGVARVNRVWGTNTTGNVTHDIVLVMDTSGSMAFDWNDRRPAAYNNGVQEAGYTGPRIEDAKAAIKTFVQNYDVTSDPDARISFITFGGENDYNTATKLQNNWTPVGCVPAQCTEELKWAPIQAKAELLTPLGGTPGPWAFERVIDQLQSAQATRNGKQVRKIVVFATDGVFNICGSSPNTPACPAGTDVCPASPFEARESCKNDPQFQSVEPRPIWQGQQLSNQVKGLGASIYIVAVQPTCVEGGGRFCFDPYGLPEMSSGNGTSGSYFFSARDGSNLNNIYEQIGGDLVASGCFPREQVELASGVTVELKKATDSNFSRTAVTRDGTGEYVFEDLEAGQYYVAARAKEIFSPEDRATRKYTRVRNGLNLGEAGRASVYLNPQFPDDATVYSEVLMSLKTVDGVPLNGCADPAETYR